MGETGQEALVQCGGDKEVNHTDRHSGLELHVRQLRYPIVLLCMAAEVAVVVNKLTSCHTVRCMPHVG